MDLLLTLFTGNWTPATEFTCMIKKRKPKKVFNSGGNRVEKSGLTQKIELATWVQVGILIVLTIEPAHKLKTSRQKVTKM